MWRSNAFAGVPSADPDTRLGRFQREYGDDVVVAAREGDTPRARELIDRWIAEHPLRHDDAWHPYPLSTRIGNWVAALTLEPELATDEVAESLWRQLLRLRTNLEYDVLGNHLVRNAKALVLGGHAFGSSELAHHGIAILRRELAEQVLGDGGHYERSPAYHLLVLRDLLEVQAVSPHSWLGDAIRQMEAFAAALQRPDGAPSLFNDGAVDAPRLELPPPPVGIAPFPDSGFVVVRELGLWLAVRCGRPSPSFLPAHAHADALSFQLWWRGRPIVVDPGTYTYEPGPERDHFRGTAAHSTIAVDGKDQFRLWGAFRSGPLAPVRLEYVREGVVEAAVDLPGRIRHVRRIAWDAGAGVVDVHDLVAGRGRHRIESRLVWSPDAPAVELEVSGGDAVVEPAWVSEQMGEREPTTATVVRVEAALPVALGFRIRCIE